MLSGETAIGEYPVMTVSTMARICSNAEKHLPEGEPLHPTSRKAHSVTEAISLATVETACDVDAKAILTATMGGTTARMVARHRPAMPIVAVTPNKRTYTSLCLVWGVQPVLVPQFATTDEMVRMLVRAGLDTGVVEPGDRVVLTAGIPFGGEGRTNMLKVHVVGEDDGAA
jgi:pyruvate kinase